MSRQFIFEKIIRDAIVDQMRSRGVTVFTRNLDHAEIVDKLKEKLSEETQEVFTSRTKEEITQELGDVIEVVRALASRYSLSFQDIVEAAESKKRDKGGFDTATYVTHISIPCDDPSLAQLMAYYEGRPKDYPAITPV